MIDNKLSSFMRRNSSGDKLQALEASNSSAYEFKMRAITLLLAKRDIIHAKQRSQDAYQLPAYSEFQADCNSTIRTIDETLKEVFNYKVGEKDAFITESKET